MSTDESLTLEEISEIVSENPYETSSRYTDLDGQYPVCGMCGRSDLYRRFNRDWKVTLSGWGALPAACDRCRTGRTRRDAEASKRREAQRSRYKKKKLVLAAQSASRKYGVSFETAVELHTTPCMICGRPADISDKSCIDHCHSTGRVRGALCSDCNLGLGHFKDSPQRLQAAVEYLNRHHDYREGVPN